MACWNAQKWPRGLSEPAHSACCHSPAHFPKFHHPVHHGFQCHSGQIQILNFIPAFLRFNHRLRVNGFDGISQYLRLWRTEKHCPNLLGLLLSTLLLPHYNLVQPVRCEIALCHWAMPPWHGSVGGGRNVFSPELADRRLGPGDPISLLH
jgi:hypothetical protein